MFDKFREECGVFGIFDHPEAANLTYLGLYALQHRGQESTGIAASDGVQIRHRKAMGEVNEAFDADALAKLTGNLAIGHVRYSTAGDSKLLNAQPIVVDSVHGQFAIGHNGNLVNAGELRDALVREGAIFQTNSDTEALVHLFARSREKGTEAAIVEAISQVRGAFSFVMMTRDRIIGVRDPPRLPAACSWSTRRGVGDVFRNLRPRSNRGELRSRRRAGRDGHCERRRAQVHQAVCARPAVAVRV